MNGQWVGTFKQAYPAGISGPGGGNLILDLDETKQGYSGVAHVDYVGDFSTILPPMDIVVEIDGKEGRRSIRSTEIAVVDRKTGLLQPWESVAEQYPNVTVPKSITGEAWLTDAGLNLQWESDIGTKGTSQLPISKAGSVSELPAKNLSWNEFKELVNQFEGNGRLFRGQKEPWRLRSSYHREGRADILKYFTEVVPEAHRILTARTKHFFSIRDNQDQLWAFLNLIQHHGFPTPLLDWTYSPYVAAFFAFRGISKKEASKTDNKARVFVFDHERWSRDYPQISLFVTRFPHVSLVKPLALENDRFVPQQAALINTNVDDIESYLSKLAIRRAPYLSAIDIPWTERHKVMRDLHFMGISAGSLFPGLDGACEELKERSFLFL